MAHPKVSHLQKTKKSDETHLQPDWKGREIMAPEISHLACSLRAVLQSSACPDKLRTAIIDALCDLQSEIDTSSADFLFGLLISRRRQTEEAKGGAA